MEVQEGEKDPQRFVTWSNVQKQGRGEVVTYVLPSFACFSS